MRTYLEIMKVLIANGLVEAELPGPLSKRWLALALPPLLLILLLSMALRGQVNAILALLLGTVAALSGWNPGGGSPLWANLVAAFAALNAVLVALWPTRTVELKDESGRVIVLTVMPLLIPITSR